MKIVILGLSITSSWGNGHATTYRALVRALGARGHEVLFLEADRPWYASNRDLRDPQFCRTILYRNTRDLEQHADEIAAAACVIVGSYVPDGVSVGEWATSIAGGVTAFYDIDTPVTLAKLAGRDHEYLSPELIPRYDLYLSFTGGPTLGLIERKYDAARARPFYCSVDPEHYFPDNTVREWDLGYLGTYSVDRQPSLERFLIEPAKALPQQRFAVAGPQYPPDVQWPRNVARIDHLSPDEHRAFYNAQRFTLNVTRKDMVRAGWSPSVRLFEAAACGTPIISDVWEGIEDFFVPGREILLARSAREAVEFLSDIPEAERRQIAQAARERVLAEHTSLHRAVELESLVAGVQQERSDPGSNPDKSLLETQKIAS